jgi:Big-like domain-containing protein
MSVKQLSLVLIVGLATLLPGCGSGSSQTSTKSAPTVTAIALSPQNSAVTVSKTIQFSAMATYSDGTQKDITSSATWSSSDSTIASVSAGTATGASKGVATITVTSGAGKATTLLNVTDLALSNGSFKGSYVFLLQGIDSVGPTFAAGSFSADGNGNVSGVVDANTSAKGLAANKSTLSGTYTLSPDGRGLLNLTIGSGASIPFRFVISQDGSKGKVIEYDGLASAIGDFEVATPGTQLSGNYVFRVGGINLGASQSHLAEVGLVLASGGALAGSADENFNGMNYSKVAIAGSSFTAADTNNRGTLTLTLADGTIAHFVYYMVSASRIFLMSTDSASGVDILAGMADAQTSVAALTDGNYIFLLDHGASSTTGTFEKMGEFTLSSGAVTQGSTHEDFSLQTSQDQHFVINPPAPGACSGTLDANGRASVCYTVTLGGQPSGRDFVIYAVNSGKAYMLETAPPLNQSASAFRAGVGEMETSTASATLPVAGDFIFSQSELGENNLLQIGQIGSDGKGGLTGISDYVSNASASNPTISAEALAPNVGWMMTPVSGFMFDYSLTPQHIAQEYFFYVRPDGNRTVMLGYFPDTDGFMDLQ